MFLLYHSILMAGFALGSTAPKIATALPILGLFASLVWVYIGHRSLLVGDYFWKRVLECEALLEPDERVFTNALNWRRSTRPPIFGVPVGIYFGRVFPWMWVITWLAALVWRT
ncbi:MAG: hypothetical protein AAB037_02885 [Chloroflexota bacterium]